MMLPEMRAWIWKPNWEKSGKRHLLEIFYYLGVGGLAGYTIPNVIIYRNPLWILPAIPGIYALVIGPMHIHRSRKEIKKLDEEFKAEHGFYPWERKKMEAFIEQLVREKKADEEKNQDKN